VGKTAATPALVAAQRAGVECRVHAYDLDSAHGSFGKQAAALLGVDPVRVFKTLVAMVDGAMSIAVVPVARELDLKRRAITCGGKRATMADPPDAERATGYVVGAISPLGQRKRLPTVVDESALRFATIFVSAGRRGLELEVAPLDMIRVTDATTAAIAR